MISTRSIIILLPWGGSPNPSISCSSSLIHESGTCSLRGWWSKTLGRFEHVCPTDSFPSAVHYKRECPMDLAPLNSRAQTLKLMTDRRSSSNLNCAQWKYYSTLPRISWMTDKYWHMAVSPRLSSPQASSSSALPLTSYLLSSDGAPCQPCSPSDPLVPSTSTQEVQKLSILHDLNGSFRCYFSAAESYLGAPTPVSGIQTNVKVENLNWIGLESQYLSWRPLPSSR